MTGRTSNRPNSVASVRHRLLVGGPGIMKETWPLMLQEAAQGSIRVSTSTPSTPYIRMQCCMQEQLSTASPFVVPIPSHPITSTPQSCPFRIVETRRGLLLMQEQGTFLPTRCHGQRCQSVVFNLDRPEPTNGAEIARSPASKRQGPSKKKKGSNHRRH